MPYFAPRGGEFNHDAPKSSRLERATRSDINDFLRWHEHCDPPSAAKTVLLELLASFDK